MTEPKKLEDRALAWLEKDDARHQETLRNRPGWWHVGKIVLGFSLFSRGVAIFIEGGAMPRYALAALMIAGGAYWVYEGFVYLKSGKTNAS